MNKIKIEKIRKASKSELAEIAKFTVAISHRPEFNGRGRAFFPTHSFEAIKKQRESVYEMVLYEFKRERMIKMVPTTEKDVKLFRLDWLNTELNEIDRIIKIPTLTKSDSIELGKYKAYVKSEINKLPREDWSSLHHDLINEYIEDVSEEDFNDVMSYKRLPNGKLKIRWMTEKSEGVYFQKEFGFSMKEFNQCFIHKDGTQFRANNLHPDYRPKKQFQDIVLKHKR